MTGDLTGETPRALTGDLTTVLTGGLTGELTGDSSGMGWEWEVIGLVLHVSLLLSLIGRSVHVRSFGPPVGSDTAGKGSSPCPDATDCVTSCNDRSVGTSGSMGSGDVWGSGSGSGVGGVRWCWEWEVQLG